MRILLLDIETAPMQVYAWSLWDKYVPIERIIEPGHTLCIAAKWLDERGIMFNSVHQSSRASMVKWIHKLLDEADAVCHYNGIKFDMPVLEAEFLSHGLKPPSPYKQIDLYRTVKRFHVPSRKLDYIAQHLGLGRKTKHKGMDLWKACMAGDAAAWRVMERYNRQDVNLLEKLYKVLLPWIKQHPNHALEGECCPNCGSEKLQWRGWYHALTRSYRKFVCKSCGSWGRSVKSEAGAKLRGVE